MFGCFYSFIELSAGLTSLYFINFCPNNSPVTVCVSVILYLNITIRPSGTSNQVCYISYHVHWPGVSFHSYLTVKFAEAVMLTQ